MANVSNAYINALLADATYITVTSTMNQDDIIDALQKRMTLTLASYIAENFEVASAIDTPDIPLLGSGFDATVWRGRAGTEFAGQVFVSTRGTEPPGIDLWGANVDLALNVAARTQIIDMVNWWLREATPAGTQATQIKWDPLRPKPGSLIEVEPGVVLADSVTATGNLAGVSSVQVNGHSLGGHLASAFARIFGGENPAATGSVRVQSIASFNSAGFNGDNAEFFFAQIQSLLGTGMDSFAGVRDRQTNFFAQNGIEVATNTWWFTQMGERVGLSQEEGTGMTNHSMYRITDALALGAAMQRLDPGFSVARLNTLLEAGSNNPAASLEGVLDGLRRALEGPGVPALPVGDAGDSDAARQNFHAALARFNQDHQALAGQLTLTPAGANLASQGRARVDFQSFVALYTLSPFVISPAGAQGQAALDALWASPAWQTLHQQWQDDRSSLGAGQPALNYSNQWYEDRAALLGRLIERNAADVQGILPGSQNLRYWDQASGTEILVGSGSAQRVQYLFGGDGDDANLVGQGFADRLYGGAGDDTLDGKGGSDHLEGGSGNDTYVLSTADEGVDTIVDADGLGRIELDGQVIAGSFGRLASAYGLGNDFYSADRQYKISQIGATDWRLFVSNGGSTYKPLADLRNWRPGELGISTDGADVQPLDAGATPGATPEINYPNSTAYINVNAGAAPRGVRLGGGTRSDSFSGSAYADRITTGDGLGNYVMANGGNDYVLGGSGREYIRAGANAAASAQYEDNDIVQGAEGTDMIYGGAGDDLLWGNTASDEYLLTAVDSGERGDWVSGEGGNDFIAGSRSQDLLFGGAGADTMLGGAGDDLILGDGQYSTSSRAIWLDYAQAVTQAFVWNSAADGFRGPLDQSNYAADPVLIANGSIYNWTWSASESDFTLNLAPGVTFLSQIRVAPEGGNDVIDGGAGNDWIAGQTGDDTLYGGEGDDVIYGDDAVPLPTGSAEGNDRLYAGAGADALHGGGGNDLLDASDADGQRDRLYGGDGDDVLTGGTGRDELYGGAGSDQLFAGSDGGLMQGGDGDDLYVGGAGDDAVHDTDGNDAYHSSGGNDGIMDLAGDDSYYINYESLRAGGTTTLTDVGGVGRLFFDGTLLTQDQVQAVSEGNWAAADGLCLLSRQGADLVLRARDLSVTGQVIVSNFFSQDSFLGLKLPPYVPAPQPNRAPAAGAPIAAQSIDEDAPFAFTVPANAFSDPDGDALSYSARLADGSALPAWLAFDVATGSFSGTPDNADVGTVQVQVTANDGKGGSASQTFALEVVNTNDAPAVGTAIGAQSTREWDAFSFTVPQSAFTDADTGDVLTYSATLANGAALPYWLRFDAASGTFSSEQVAQGYAGRLDIQVTATDMAGASASQSFALDVAANQRLRPVQGTPGFDWRAGTSGDDLIIGGQGNDILWGGLGNDTYRWSKGDGNDLITELGGNDTIEFTDVNADDVRITRTLLGDMQIEIVSTGEKITASLALSAVVRTAYIEQIRFADGTSWDRNEMIRRSKLPKRLAADVAPGQTLDWQEEAIALKPMLVQPDALVQAMASFGVPAAAETGTLVSMPQHPSTTAMLLAAAM